jgi:NADPH:quinone reductase
MSQPVRQVQIDEFGGPDVLHVVEVPDPEPGPGQVAVRTAAAGVTFVETQVRAGRHPWPGPGPRLPAVLGNGVEGTIVSAGAGVSRSLVGTTVVTATGGLGGYAELAVVGASDPVRVQEGLRAGEAVAMLADGRTALAVSRAAACTVADRVLVLAAAGGVGSLLVQLARSAGAKHVVAAAGGARKLDLASTLGADVVADYTSADWLDQVRAAVGGLDVVFDGIGGDVGAAAASLVEHGGRFAAYGAASGKFVSTDVIRERGVLLIAGNTLVRSPEDNRALVEQGLAALAAGRLRPVIGQVFAFDQAAQAHATIEARATVGKTILVPGLVTDGAAESPRW